MTEVQIAKAKYLQGYLKGLSAIGECSDWETFIASLEEIVRLYNELMEDLGAR